MDGNCVIDVPAGVTGQVYQSDFSGNCIFDLNKEFTWPLIEDKQGRTVDLSQVMTPDKKIAYNIYLKNLQEGLYGITNLKKKVGIGFRWDVNIFKYLLMWSVYRGYYHFPFYGRTYNLALELYSAIPDNLDEVIRLHRELSLMPGEELKTRFFTTIYESGQRIQGFDDEYQPISRKS
ncbi:MAG: hypothetical protein NTX88_00855 [Candidatus Atribacteria bacterium]|nr:hypothetical protein [Candidatus Atribacteria bacterium]